MTPPHPSNWRARFETAKRTSSHVSKGGRRSRPDWMFRPYLRAGLRLVTPPLSVDPLGKGAVSAARSLRANARVGFSTIIAIYESAVLNSRPCSSGRGPGGNVFESDDRIELQQAVADPYMVAKEVG